MSKANNQVVPLPRVRRVGWTLVSLLAGAFVTVCLIDLEARSGEAQNAAVQGVPTLEVIAVRPPDPVVPAHAAINAITRLEDLVEIDVQKPGIRPPPTALAAPAASDSPGTLDQAVGTGSAYTDIAPRIVALNKANAFVTVGANFTPGETVEYYIDGVFSTSATTD